ncbi:MAG TPA: hypothetical protein VLB00_13275 [Gemmatimonadales bacterium]|nr:hypothetical protein [Gemmatimonadales bacterium]
MRKGAVPPALVVIDLQEPGTQAHLLRSLLGSGVLGWTGIGASPWLVLAPPGDGGDRSWCRGTQVLEPAGLFDANAVQAMTRQVVEVSSQVIATLRPAGAGLHLGELNRAFIQTWVHDLLYREGAVLAACRTLGLSRCRIFSTSVRRARWIAAGIGHAGVDAGVTGFPARLRSREKPVRGYWAIGEALPRADLLMVAESPPMRQMFSVVGDTLPAPLRSQSLQLAYVSGASAAYLAAVREVPMRWVNRAPSGDPSEGPIGAPAAHSGDLGEEASPSVRASFDALRRRIVDDQLPRQQHWARHVLQVLGKIGPQVLVVGNDRFWTGQTYTRLGDSLGIRTVCLQDGIAAPVPNHTYSTAAHVLAAGTLWPALLSPNNGRPRSVSVVGQPRYDRARTAFEERRRREPLPPSRARNRVLLILQDIHRLDYARTILAETLRVEGTHVMIRAHPAFRPAGLDRLAGPRVRFSPGGNIVDDLAGADLVVTEYSTVAVEALALGLPVLSVTLSGRPPLLDFTVPGQAEGVTERSQIAAAVVRLLGATPPSAGSPARQAILDQLVGPLDDRSASRVGDILSGLLEGTSTA